MRRALLWINQGLNLMLRLKRTLSTYKLLKGLLPRRILRLALHGTKGQI